MKLLCDFLSFFLCKPLENRYRKFWRIRSTKSRKRQHLPLPQREMLLLCQPVRRNKCSYLTTLERSPKQLNASDQWIINSPKQHGIPPSTGLLFLLSWILLMVPFLINFLSWFLRQQIESFLTRSLISCYYEIIRPYLWSLRLPIHDYTLMVKIKPAAKTLMSTYIRK